jgi:hypothetical protein
MRILEKIPGVVQGGCSKNRYSHYVIHQEEFEFNSPSPMPLPAPSPMPLPALSISPALREHVDKMVKKKPRHKHQGLSMDARTLCLTRFWFGVK